MTDTERLAFEKLCKDLYVGINVYDKYINYEPEQRGLGWQARAQDSRCAGEAVYQYRLSDSANWHQCSKERFEKGADVKGVETRILCTRPDAGVSDDRAALRASAKDFDEVLRENNLRCECGEPDCRTTRLDAQIAKLSRDEGNADES